MLTKLFGPAPRRRASEGDDDGGGSANPWSSSDVGPNFARRIQTLAGSRVDEDIALTHSAVWCATRIIIETVAGLPLHLYEKTDTDGREKASDEPLFDVLDVAPNPDMDAVAFREGRTGHQLNFGNGFSEIVREDARDPTSPVAALWPIHPSRVRPTYAIDGVDRDEFPYMVRNTDMTLVPMRRDELLHIPGVFPEDGNWGKGVIAYAREAIGGAFSVDRHGYAYFGNGAQPKGVMKLPAMLIKNKEQRGEFRKEWREFHGDPNSSEVLLVPTDADYSPIAISNNDSQFLDTRKFSVGDIARWYRLPVYMFGVYEQASARASVEAQAIDFVMYSLMPWLRKWEGQLNLKLLSPKQRGRFFIEHNLAGLLRGDTMARYNAYRTAITSGFMTINQACRLENLPTIGPAGNVNYVPLNMTTAKAMEESPPMPGARAPGGGAPPGQPPKGKPGNPDGATDEPAGQTGGAFLAWAVKAAEKLERRRQGKQTRRPRSVVIHADDTGKVKAAARGVVADVLGRFASKEANAAGRAAKGNGWDQWAAEFYPKHQEQLAAALKPAGELLAAVGLPFDATKAAAAVAAHGRAALSAAYDGDTPAAFADRLAAWPGEAAKAADGILEGGGDEGGQRDGH